MSRAIIRRLLPSVLLLLSLLFAALTAVSQTAVSQTVSIHDIMTSLPDSPLLGQNVTASAIVTGVLNQTARGNGGFYLTLQNPDNLASTAEGILVAGSSVPSCNAVAVGQVVTVTGVVTNSLAPNLTAANTPGTYLVPSVCSAGGTASMTNTISLRGALTTFGDALKYTGMAISDTTFYAVGPTGTVSSTTGAVISTGQFWATLTSNSGTNNHLFRSPGFAGDEYTLASLPAGLPTWSGNPQRVLIDTTSFGGSPVDVAVGQTVTCSNSNSAGPGATGGVGLVDYTLGYARILIFKSVTCAVSGSAPASVTAAADTTHFKVGTLDVNSFMGSTQSLPTAIAKATLAVTNVFGSPDIFALQEADNQPTLLQLAASVNDANSGSTNYTATVLGTEPTNSGFLVNTATVKNANYFEVGRGATYTASTGAATLWDHPPLVLQAEFARAGRNYPVIVINVHMTPRDNIGDTALGPGIRARRAAQAAAISTLVQQYQAAGANVIVAGNLNAYEYNDGYVDVVGIIDGSPAAATAVTLYQASNTTAPLTDFTTGVPANTRYNIIERGNAAALEHILASATVTDSTTAPAPLASYINAITQPHFSTDYKAIDGNDATTLAGLTPHDGFLVNFAIPPVPTTASVAPAALAFANVSPGDRQTLTTTVTNTTPFTSTVNITNIAISGTDAGDYSQTSTCTSLSMGSTCTVSVTFAPTVTGTRTATLTVTTDATGNPTLTMPLTGTVPDTTATLTPASADFGMQILNTTSAAKVFTWTNTSTMALAIASVDATGDYSVSGTTCVGRIAASASCAISVVFAPIALRTRAGTLTVISAASLQGVLTASLTGVGVADVEASVDTIDFGTVDVSTASAPQTVTITNFTNAAITLTGISVSGDYSQAADTCGSTLAGGASCAVTLVFTPTTIGIRAGALIVTTRDTKFPFVTVALTGNGVDFSVTVAPTSGSVIAGLSLSPVATVTPLGGYGGTVTMRCTTIATGAGCEYNLKSFVLNAATTDGFTIVTTSKYAVIGYGSLLFAPRHRGLLATLLTLCGAGLLVVARRSSRAARLLLAFVALSVAAGGMSGCGTRNPALNAPYTAPGTYEILITASDGTSTRTATYSLTVTAK